MPWSTSQLAELAGTTVNTVRHYHRVGLLEEPERRYNGYKQYEVRHLVNLLRIRRLADLGVPLSQIDQVRSGDETTPDTLRALDAELRNTGERLQKARSEIAALLRTRAPADTPPGFESVASRLSEADTAMIHIYAQMYDQGALDDIREMTEADDVQLAAEVDGLPADADDETRQDLITRLAPTIARNLVDYPWLSDPASRVTGGRHGAAETFVDAVIELYNPAQLDVLGRASLLAIELAQAQPTQL